jgi:hypothetical protein
VILLPLIAPTPVRHRSRLSVLIFRLSFSA